MDIDDANDGDDGVHSPPPRKGAKKVAGSASSAKKMGPWSHGEDTDLCLSILTYVEAHKGQLPGAVRTADSAACTPAWKDIASRVEKVEKLDKEKGGKACSTRWTKIRLSVKVRAARNIARRR